jgi:uncharacterized HAD superfamily protein
VERGLVPLLVTARMAKYRQVTQRWLERHEIPINHIWMRSNGDFRKDAVVKREILKKIRLQYDPVEATDDNPAVIEVWENEGLVTHIVPGWNSP